jgi:cyclopropane fatty-acyl-phospholipid synthase-like methyltransferase
MIERFLALQPESRVLDVPCGNGRLTIPLARRSYRLSGIDFTSLFRRRAARGNRRAADHLPGERHARVSAIYPASMRR